MRAGMNLVEAAAGFAGVPLQLRIPVSNGHYQKHHMEAGNYRHLS
jgi:hypothetical protein